MAVGKADAVSVASTEATLTNEGQKKKKSGFWGKLFN